MMLANAKFDQALFMFFGTITRIPLPTILGMVFRQVSHYLIAGDLGNNRGSGNGQGPSITLDDGPTGI